MSELQLVEQQEFPVFRGESYEEHVNTWLEVDGSIQGHYWMLGAVADSLESKYGENTTGKFASDVGCSARRVRQYRETYRAWESGTRVPSLSFKHHMLAARADDPEQALQTAADEDLSTRELEELVQTGELPERSVHFQSESHEWYTPPHVVDRVLAVLGEIDLDPCAEDARSVPAREHLTRAEDGLSRAWSGRVYMNPPYKRDIPKWITKLKAEYERGDVTEAVALVPARTDTEWFSELRVYLRCFIVGRLKFSGHHNSAPFPSAVFYLGDEGERFAEAFEGLGDIYKAVRL